MAYWSFDEGVRFEADLAAEAEVRSLGDLLRVLLAFDIFSLLGFVWAESERSNRRNVFTVLATEGCQQTASDPRL